MKVLLYTFFFFALNAQFELQLHLREQEHIEHTDAASSEKKDEQSESEVKSEVKSEATTHQDYVLTYTTGNKIMSFHKLHQDTDAAEEQNKEDQDEDTSSGGEFTVNAIFKGSAGRISAPVELKMKKVGKDYVYDLSEDEGTQKTKLDFPGANKDRKLSGSNKNLDLKKLDLDISDKSHDSKTNNESDSSHNSTHSIKSKNTDVLDLHNNTEISSKSQDHEEIDISSSSDNNEETQESDPKELYEYDVINNVKQIHKVVNDKLVTVILFEITDVDDSNHSDENDEEDDEERKLELTTVDYKKKSIIL